MRQHTPEWRSARLGNVTASRIADIVARTKGGHSASRANYAAQLACERLTDRPVDGYTSAAMQWGLVREAEARLLYEFTYDAPVTLAGFLEHPNILRAGASPDGLVGQTGLVEIKCPLSATHIETLIGRAPPARYLTQMQWQMAVTGRRWCDFVSYDPRLPADLQLFVQRIDRDPVRIGELEHEVRAFLDEVEALVRGLRRQASAGAFVGARARESAA